MRLSFFIFTEIMKLNTRTMYFFSNCEIKYPQNLVPLRYYITMNTQLLRLTYIYMLIFTDILKKMSKKNRKHHKYGYDRLWLFVTTLYQHVQDTFGTLICLQKLLTYCFLHNLQEIIR